jgi:hypothetical protein
MELATAWPECRLVVTKETMTVEGMIKIVYDLLKDKLNIHANGPKYFFLVLLQQLANLHFSGGKLFFAYSIKYFSASFK